VSGAALGTDQADLINVEITMSPWKEARCYIKALRMAVSAIC
jgi:hypothetical protein